MTIIVPISQARFNALTFSRSPLVNYIAEEKEWYSDSQEIVLGALLFDKSDNALNPVPMNLFSGIAHHYLEDGQLVSEIPYFFPYASITQIFAEK